MASFLQSIPDVVWSGIVASAMTLIGTLGGVIATNFGNTKRLRLQLDHDTEEKSRERLATLRRELYLKAAEASIRANAYFGTLPQADFTEPSADMPLRDVLAVGAQLQLVVNQSTAQLVSELVSLYGELQLALAVKVMPIHELRTDIEIRNSHYDNTQAEIKRVLAALTHYNESGQRDTELFDRINRSFEFARSRAEEIATERSALWDQSNALQREYMKALLPEMKRLGELQLRVMVELRRELDVGGRRTRDRGRRRSKRVIAVCRAAGRPDRRSGGRHSDADRDGLCEPSRCQHAPGPRSTS